MAQSDGGETTTPISSMEEQIQNLRLSDADLQQEHLLPSSGENDETSTNDNANANANNSTNENLPTTIRFPFRFIPLRMGGAGGRTHVPSAQSIAMMRDEVSLEDLTHMTELFYQKAFQDATLDKLIRSHNDPHGSRFAKWIHQKLSNSHVWDLDRKRRDLTPVTVAGGKTTIVHDRSSAHAAAWYSPKRPLAEVGRHFKLDECRVWMRLHFWALRESGLLDKSPTFVDLYVRFLGHFVRVYETAAPQFARDSFRWSANPHNIEIYMTQNGRQMKDVLGLTLQQAMQQIPETEFHDMEWPYNQTMATDSESSSSDSE